MHSRRFAYFYIIIVIIFADTYIGLPWIRVITIMNYLLLGIIILKRGVNAFFGFNRAQRLFFIFIFYVFLINLLKNSFQDAVSYFAGAFTFPFIWKSFSEFDDNESIIKFFVLFYLIFSSFFSLLQMMGIPITAGTILSFTGVIKTDMEYSGITSQGLRITGADMNSVGYACVLGIILIYYYFRFEENRRLKYLSTVFFILILLIFTQSRAAIFLIIPVIAITKIITLSRIKDRVLLIISVALLSIIIVIFFLPVLKSEFPRLFLPVSEDGSVVHRIQANIYGSVGTIIESPIFGVAFSEGLEAMKIGYQKVGLFIGSYFIPIVTHHNQPLFFLRYFGLIGLFLLLLFYFRILKSSLSWSNPLIVRQILLGIILFHFLYTMTHNNKVTMDYYFFIMLSFNINDPLNSINDE